MKFREAVAQVERHLYHEGVVKQGADPNIKVSICFWYEDFDEKKMKQLCRVSEVSFSTERGGCAFMQSDVPHGLAMCAQVERCILALRAYDLGPYDVAEEFERLSWLLQPPPARMVGPLDTHTGTLVSGGITCACGWESGHYAIASDAHARFREHLREVGVAI